MSTNFPAKRTETRINIATTQICWGEVGGGSIGALLEAKHSLQETEYCTFRWGSEF